MEKLETVRKYNTGIYLEKHMCKEILNEVAVRIYAYKRECAIDKSPVLISIGYIACIFLLTWFKYSCLMFSDKFMSNLCI